MAIEKSMAKSWRVVREYLQQRSPYPTDYYGPADTNLSTLPDYGKSNAALPRGENPSILPFEDRENVLLEETISKKEADDIAAEIRQIRAELKKDKK